jgi:phospholipid/cholesterol/gamma-HCH transport system permease protein
VPQKNWGLMADAAWCRTSRDGRVAVLDIGGEWTLPHATRLERIVADVERSAVPAARIDLGGLQALDTLGAWLLHRLIRRLENQGGKVTIGEAAPEHRVLLQRMMLPPERTTLSRPYVPLFRAFAEHIGESTVEIAAEGRNLIGFLGLTSIAVARALLRPRRIRFVALASHVERVGLNALPIVGLLSFLIGVVLSYQGADQLRAFGAEIYSVNLVGVSVLREIGVLLTAILVAGRSGSAFTAEIGTMKVNEEVDAMKTLGLDVMDVLVLPRLLAVIIALPLLTFFADLAALTGGALMSLAVLGISLPQFLEQLRSYVTEDTFWVGMIKAPFFAGLIGLVGCYEGLKVEGGADSVGRMTTKAVVESIFLVIVADAAFSIMFSYLGF